jgi:hypothetical protein
MATFPSSVGLKINRASEHLLQLHALCEQFSQGETYTPAIDEACLDSTRIYVLAQHAPPEQISVIVGDVVHNLRSALDHVVWALGNPPDPKSCFPIFDTEDGFSRRGVAVLKGTPESTKDAIRRHQPYQLGADARHHPLWLLHLLSNVDKHRKLSAVGSYSVAPGAALRERSGQLVTLPASISQGVLRAGDEIARFPLSRAEVGRRELDLEIQGSTMVTLDEGLEWVNRPLSGVLKEVVLYVRDKVVPDLRGHFD